MPVITINVIILALEMKELRLREGKQGAQGHTASKRRSGAVHSGLSDFIGPSVLWVLRVSAWSSERPGG